MPMICEGPQKNIGCMCDGEFYQGNANRTVSGVGVPCLQWKNNPFLQSFFSKAQDSYGIAPFTHLSNL